MDNKKWLLINDLDEFVDQSRLLVFKFFGAVNEEANDSMTVSIAQMSTDEIEEMDQTLTKEESLAIVKNHAKKKTNKKTKITKYYITEKILFDIIEDLNARMISNILMALVNKGVLESAFDTDQNDFIFWLKDDNNSQDQKPETD